MNEQLDELDHDLDERYGAQMSRNDFTQGIVDEAEALKPLIETSSGSFDPATFVYAYLSGFFNQEGISNEMAAGLLLGLSTDGTIAKAIATVSSERSPE